MPNNRNNKPNKRDIRINSKWLQNSLRSLGLASVDALKEIMPATVGTASSAATVAKSAITDIRKNKNNVRNLGNVISNTPVVKMGQDFFKNALEDLRTGNLYNDKRDGGDFDLDNFDTGSENLSFGDMDEDSSGTINITNNLHADSGVGEATIKAIDESSKRQVQSAQVMTNTMVSLSSTAMLQASQIGSEIVSELTNISSKLDTMIEYNNSNMTKFIEASIAYYEQVSPKKDEEAANKITAANLFSKDGFSIQTYKDFIKQNFGSIGDNSELAGMIKMVLDNSSFFTANPIGGLMTLAMTSAVPQSIKATLEAIDTGVNDKIQSLLEDVGSWGSNDFSLPGQLKQIVGGIFGTKTRFKGKNNARDIKEGPMQYNGIANHSITEVIPKYLRESTEYLRVIAEKVTGKSSKEMRGNVEVFDREKNIYTTLSKLQADMEERYLNEVGNAFSNTTIYKMIEDKLKDSDISFDDRFDLLKGMKNSLGNKLSQQNRNISVDEFSTLINNIKGIDPRTINIINDLIESGAINRDNISAARIAATRGQNSAMTNINQGKNAEFLANWDPTERLNELFGNVVFGEAPNEKKKKEASEKTDYLFNLLKGNISDKFDFIKNAASGTVYSPILDKIGTVAESIADTFKEKIWDPLSMKLFGSKNEELGKYGYVEGGLLSGLNNHVMDVLNKAKFLVTGESYKDSKGTLHEDDGKGSMFSRIKASFHTLLYGTEDETDEEGNVKLGKKGLIKSFKEGFNKVSSGFFKAIHNWKIALTGSDEETDEEKGKQIIKDTLDKVKNVLPGGIVGGAAGGIIGSLVGGPVVGSLIGFATGVVSQSKSLKKFLFGDAEYDEDGNLVSKTTNGLISEDTKKWFKDNKVAVGTGMGAGLIGTLIGGPVVGALTGLATTFGQTGDIFKRFLYGDEEYNIKGFGQIWKDAVGKFNVNFGVNEDDNKFLGMTAVSTIASGGLMGLAFGPGGLIGGSLFGLGASILAQKENFHDWLFGKDEEIDGKKVHREGILGQFKNMLSANVMLPLRDAFIDMKDNFQTWLEYDVLAQIKLIAAPVLDGFFSGISALTGKAFESFQDAATFLKEDVFKKIVEHTKNILSPVTEAFIKVGKTITNVAGKIVSAPLKVAAAIAGPIASVFKGVADVVGTTINAVLITPIKELVVKPLIGIAKGFGKIVAAPFKLLNKITEKIGDKVSEASAFITDFIREEIVKPMTDKIKDVGASIVKTITWPFKKMGDLVKSAAGIITETAKGVLTGVGDVAKRTIAKITNPIKEFFFGDGKDNKGIFGSFGSGIVSKFRERWKNRTNKDGSQKDNIVTSWKNRIAQNKENARIRKDHRWNSKQIAKLSGNQFYEDTEENREKINNMLKSKGKATIDWKGDALQDAVRQATIEGNKAEKEIVKNTEALVNFYKHGKAQTNEERAAEEKEKLKKNLAEGTKNAADKTFKEDGPFSKFMSSVKQNINDRLEISRLNEEGFVKTALGVMGVGGKAGLTALNSIFSGESLKNVGKSWYDSLGIAKITGKDINKHAKGTDNAPGGPSVVGEEGSEIIMSPDKATLGNIVPGSKVISNGNTEDLIDATVETANVLTDAQDKSSGALKVTVNENDKGIKGFFEKIKSFITGNDKSNSDDNATLAEASDSGHSNVVAMENMIDSDNEIGDQTAANQRAIDEAKRQNKLTEEAQKATIATSKNTEELADGEKKKEGLLAKIGKFVFGGGLGEVVKNGLLIAGAGLIAGSPFGKALGELAIKIGAKIKEVWDNSVYPWIKDTAIPAIKKWWTDKAWPWIKNTAIPWVKDTLIPALWNGFKTAIGITGELLRALFSDKVTDTGNGNKSVRENIDDLEQEVKEGNILQIGEDGKATALTTPTARVLINEGTRAVAGYHGLYNPVIFKGTRFEKTLNLAKGPGAKIGSTAYKVKTAVGANNAKDVVKSTTDEIIPDVEPKISTNATIPEPKTTTISTPDIESYSLSEYDDYGFNLSKTTDATPTPINMSEGYGGVDELLGDVNPNATVTKPTTEIHHAAPQGRASVTDDMLKNNIDDIGKNAASYGDEAIEAAGEAKKGLFAKVKGYIDEFLSFVAKKFTEKTGMPIIRENGIIAKISKTMSGAIDKYWMPFCRKISEGLEKLGLGLSSEAVSAGMILVGEMIVGSIEGVSGTAKLFHISKSDVDPNMQLISGIFGLLASTSLGGFINLILSIVNMVTGLDILCLIATELYKLISDPSKFNKIADAQDKFKEIYDQYKDEKVTANYETAIKVGAISADTSKEDFLLGVQTGKYGAEYKSQSDYSAEVNASIGDKIFGFIGGGLKKAGEVIFTGNDNKEYADKNGNTYKRAKDGLMHAYDSKGNDLGAIAEEMVQNMSGIEMTSEGTKGLWSDIFAEQIANRIVDTKNDWEDFKAYITDFGTAIKEGRYEDLTKIKYNPLDHTGSELFPFFGAIASLGNSITYPIIGLSKIGNNIKEGFNKIKNGDITKSIGAATIAMFKFGTSASKSENDNNYMDINFADKYNKLDEAHPLHGMVDGIIKTMQWLMIPICAIANQGYKTKKKFEKIGTDIAKDGILLKAGVESLKSQADKGEIGLVISGREIPELQTTSILGPMASQLYKLASWYYGFVGDFYWIGKAIHNWFDEKARDIKYDNIALERTRDAMITAANEGDVETVSAEADGYLASTNSIIAPIFGVQANVSRVFFSIVGSIVGVGKAIHGWISKNIEELSADGDNLENARIKMAEYASEGNVSKIWGVEYKPSGPLSLLYSANAGISRIIFSVTGGLIGLGNSLKGNFKDFLAGGLKDYIEYNKSITQLKKDSENGNIKAVLSNKYVGGNSVVSPVFSIMHLVMKGVNVLTSTLSGVFSVVKPILKVLLNKLGIDDISLGGVAKAVGNVAMGSVREESVDIRGGNGGYGPDSLNGGTYYSQNDSRWSDRPYKRSDGYYDGATMKTAGCGPTAMAMAMSDATGRKIDPVEMANMATKSGYRDDTGTNYNFIDNSASRYGVVSNRKYHPSSSDIINGLSNGNSVVLAGRSVNGGNYTNRGHYLVATGVDKNNNIYINDPRGREYSGKRPLSSIVGDTNAIWEFGGYGPNFPVYNDLSANELKGLANIIQHEQPGIEGYYAEASQMANLTDMKNSSATKNDLIKKATSGWYANGKARYEAGKSGSTSIDSNALDAAKAVFVEGKRTLPRYVNEHDYRGDIASISTGDKNNNADYIPHKTIITQNGNIGSGGGKWTFYGFPNEKADPFGYTDSSLRTKYGDTVWNLSTKKFTDGSSGPVGASSSSLWVAIVKAVKKAIADKKPGYHQAYVGCKINVGGREIEVRPDCSGLVMACLKYYGYDTAIATSNMLDDSSPLKKTAKFTRRSWNGWDDLKEGEVIVRPGHTEIFAKNEGGKHYVWNCGSDKTVNNPDISMDNSNYTVVWTPGPPGANAISASDLGVTLSSDASTGGASTNNESFLSKITGAIGKMGSALWNAVLTGNWDIDWASVFADNAANTADISSSYDSTDSSSTDDTSSSGGITTTDAAPKIWKYLKGKGFNDIGSAGVMGCWQAESHNDPATLEGYYLNEAAAKDAPSTPEKLDAYTKDILFPAYKKSGLSIKENGYKYNGHYYPGFGLAQWTGSRGYRLNNYAKSIGSDWRRLGTQLDFFWSEFGNRKGLLDKMNNSSSAADATTEFLDGFEMNSPTWHTTEAGAKQNKTRREFATQIYDKYKGTEGKSMGIGDGLKVGKISTTGTKSITNPTNIDVFTGRTEAEGGGGFGEGYDTTPIIGKSYYTSSRNNPKTTVPLRVMTNAPSRLNGNVRLNRSTSNDSNMEILINKVIELLDNISNNSNNLKDLKNLKSEVILNNNNNINGVPNNGNNGVQHTNTLNKVSTNEEAARSIAYGY